MRLVAMGKQKILEQNRCFICGSLTKIETHHIDWHHENPDPNNKVKLCQVCHSIIHKEGYMSIEEMRAIREKVFNARQAMGEPEEEILKYYPADFGERWRGSSSP